MKIKKIDIYYFDIPLKEPFRISIGTMHGANNVLVRILTDSGLIGLGESCPFPPITGETQETNMAAARSLRDLLTGKDPLAIEDFVREAGSFLRSNPSMVAAFDMALYDILGKASSLPLFRLLGGSRSTLETDITTDLDAPKKMAAKAKRFVAAGYKKIKIKVRGLRSVERAAKKELAAEPAAQGMPVSAQEDVVQLTLDGLEPGLDRLAGLVEHLPDLLLPDADESLCRLTPGLVPAFDEPVAGLGIDQALPLEEADGVVPQPQQDDAQPARLAEQRT
jgi:hypothetical protein